MQSNKESIGRGEVWVVDESGMMGSRKLARFLKMAEEFEAKVVLIGDSKQFQAVEQGKMFADLQKHPGTGYAEITEVRRQKTKHMKEIVSEFKKRNAGAVKDAFEKMSESGRVHHLADRTQRLASVARDYLKDREDGIDSIVLTATNKDRADLNSTIREALLEKGTVSAGFEFETLQNAGISGALMGALDDDKSGYSWTEYYCGGGCGGYWDPYGDWKWRSAYMEGRYATNGNETEVMANCWGTTDYLARDYQWAEGYSSYKAWAANQEDPVIPAWAATFPYIYLDNAQYGNDYSIDHDLDPANGRADLTGHGRYTWIHPRGKLNSFDVIRLSNDPDEWDEQYHLIIDSKSLGYNVHSTSFLCTDEDAQVWVYEKHNFGDTEENPYGLNKHGYCQHLSDPEVFHHRYDCYNSRYN